MTVNSIFDGFNIDFVTGNCKLHYSLGINLFNGYRLFYTIIKDLDAIVCLLWNLAKFQFTTWINYFNKKKQNTPSKQDIVHAHLTTSADHIFICLWLKWRNDEGKSYALSINGWTRSNLTYKVINALFLFVNNLTILLSSIRRSFTHLSVCLFVCASQTQFKWLQI